MFYDGQRESVAGAPGGGGWRHRLPALGRSGSQSIVKDEWRLRTMGTGWEQKKGGSGKPDTYYGPVSSSLRVLRKASSNLGPILSDWPENKTDSRGLAKRTGWEQYRSGEFQFASLGSMLQVEIRNGGKLLDRVVLGGRLATAPVVYNNVAYFGGRDGYVQAYDLKAKTSLAFSRCAFRRTHVVRVPTGTQWPVEEKEDETDDCLSKLAATKTGGYAHFD